MPCGIDAIISRHLLGKLTYTKSAHKEELQVTKSPLAQGERSALECTPDK